MLERAWNRLKLTVVTGVAMEGSDKWDQALLTVAAFSHNYYFCSHAAGTNIALGSVTFLTGSLQCLLKHW